MSTKFNSFEEIDDQLKILSLKREINKERVKLKFGDLKTHLYPMNILKGLDGKLTRILVPLVFTRLLKRKSS